jgi:transposase
LRQVNGVGPVTSLAYVLTLETPQHFKKSRDVGPYLGLVPQQEDSGDSQPQLGISKAGDWMLRKLLVGSAHYILGPFGPVTDLQRFGMKLCQRILRSDFKPRSITTMMDLGCWDAAI